MLEYIEFKSSIYLIVYFLITGGIFPIENFGPNIANLQILPKKTADDIIKATERYSGQEVTVKLTIQNRLDLCL